MSGALLATLGTMLWPMAALGYDVLVEALALALILRAGTGDAAGRRWALAGLAFGAAIATRLGAAVLGVLGGGAAPRPAPLGPRAGRAALGGLRGGRPAGRGAGALVQLASAPARRSPSSRRPRWDTLEQLACPGSRRRTSRGWPDSSSARARGSSGTRRRCSAWWPRAVPLARRYGAAWPRWASQLVGQRPRVRRIPLLARDWAWGPRYVAPLCMAAAPLAWWVVERALARGSAWAPAGRRGGAGRCHRVAGASRWWASPCEPTSP